MQADPDAAPSSLVDGPITAGPGRPGRDPGCIPQLQGLPVFFHFPGHDGRLKSVGYGKAEMIPSCTLPFTPLPFSQPSRLGEGGGGERRRGRPPFPSFTYHRSPGRPSGPGSLIFLDC
jgi:hypothetical protein